MGRCFGSHRTTTDVESLPRRSGKFSRLREGQSQLSELRSDVTPLLSRKWYPGSLSGRGIQPVWCQLNTIHEFYFALCQMFPAAVGANGTLIVRIAIKASQITKKKTAATCLTAT